VAYVAKAITSNKCPAGSFHFVLEGNEKMDYSMSEIREQKEKYV
jgi:hypothetical protein